MSPAPSLAQLLQHSLDLLAERHGARFVPREALPTEAELHAVHAQLARICRESDQQQPKVKK